MRNIIGLLSIVIPYLLLSRLLEGYDTQGVSLSGAFLAAAIPAAISLADKFTSGSGAVKQSRQSEKLAKASFNDVTLQKLLPPSLRFVSGNRFEGFTPTQLSGDVQAGVQGIGNLIKSPGTLSPTVANALSAMLSRQSFGIAQKGRGSQVGADPLRSLALNLAQEGGQRTAREGALGESDVLKRQDLGQTFNILDAVLQFLSSGRGQTIAGLQGSGQLALQDQQRSQQRNAAVISAIGSALSGIGGGGKGK
jgi:hypothetical protein